MDRSFVGVAETHSVLWPTVFTGHAGVVAFYPTLTISRRDSETQIERAAIQQTFQPMLRCTTNDYKIFSLYAMYALTHASPVCSPPCPITRAAAYLRESGHLSKWPDLLDLTFWRGESEVGSHLRKKKEEGQGSDITVPRSLISYQHITFIRFI